MALGKKPVNGGSATSELVIGAAASSLKKATIELREAAKSVDNLESRSEELSLNIATREEKIAQLDVEYAEKKRRLDVQLELDAKESETQVVNRVLAEQGKIPVPQTEWATLNTNLLNIKGNYDEDVKAERGKAEGIAKSKYENEKKILEAEFNAKEAGNVAQINNLTQQVEVYKSQSAMLQKQLEAERQASVERAKASSIGTIQVGSDTNNRR